jgi:hypothetical protein
LQEVQRIYQSAVPAHLEVDVVTGRIAAAADCGDYVPALNPLPHTHQVFLVVGVDGQQAVGMFNLDEMSNPEW